MIIGRGGKNKRNWLQCQKRIGVNVGKKDIFGVESGSGQTLAGKRDKQVKFIDSDRNLI